MALVNDITPAMLRQDFRERINPGATYHDVERFLEARWRRLRKGTDPEKADAIRVMIAECRAERSMIAARRAGLPKLQPWL